MSSVFDIVTLFTSTIMKIVPKRYDGQCAQVYYGTEMDEEFWMACLGICDVRTDEEADTYYRRAHRSIPSGHSHGRWGTTGRVDHHRGSDKSSSLPGCQEIQNSTHPDAGPWESDAMERTSGQTWQCWPGRSNQDPTVILCSRWLQTVKMIFSFNCFVFNMILTFNIITGFTRIYQVMHTYFITILGL